MKILKKLNSAETSTQKCAVVRSLLFMDVTKISSAVSTRIVLGKEDACCSTEAVGYRTREDDVVWKPLLLQATGACNPRKK